jgi:hypothetical protein
VRLPADHCCWGATASIEWWDARHVAHIRALNEPGLADKYRHAQHHLAAAVAGQIRAAVTAGELRAGLDPDVEAHILLALASGLSSDLLLDICSADQALMLLDHQLRRLT